MGYVYLLDDVICRALLYLDARQTEFEQMTRTTVERNGVGFNTPDARVLGRLAAKARKHGVLSDEELAVVRERLPKYWRQLADFFEEEKGLIGDFSPKISNYEWN